MNGKKNDKNTNMSINVFIPLDLGLEKITQNPKLYHGISENLIILQ